MPNYYLQTFTCHKEFTLVLSLKEKEGQISCPSYTSDKIEPQITTFYTKTSKKS